MKGLFIMFSKGGDLIGQNMRTDMVVPHRHFLNTMPMQMSIPVISRRSMKNSGMAENQGD